MISSEDFLLLIFCVVAPLALLPHLHPGIKKLKALFAARQLNPEERQALSGTKSGFGHKFYETDLKRFLLLGFFKLLYILVAVAGLIYLSYHLGLFIIRVGNYFLS